MGKFMIPNKIFQTSDCYDHPLVQDNIKKIMEYNPDGTYRHFDSNEVEEFINHNYGRYFLNLYHSLNPKYGAARADFFRYLLMYVEGGTYLDIKSGLNKPLSKIIKGHRYIISHWDNYKGSVHEGYGLFFKDIPRGEIQQFYISCEPGHLFLKKVIERIVSNIESYEVKSTNVGFWGVLKTTGPVAYTQSLYPLLRYRNLYTLHDTNEIAGMVYNNLSLNYRSIIYSNGSVHYSKLTEPLVLK